METYEKTSVRAAHGGVDGGFDGGVDGGVDGSVEGGGGVGKSDEDADDALWLGAVPRIREPPALM